MSEQTNGFDQNGRTATEVDIPILKKKEKERKGAGLVLPGAVPGGAQVAGGAGLAKAGGLLALLSGKMGLAALALGAMGAGVIGFGLSQQKGAAARKAAPELGALESNISVDRRDAKGSKSLSYMARAGAGQLRWDDPNKPKPAAAPEKSADAPADVAEAEGAADGVEEAAGQGGAERPRMANDLSGAKLSSQLGKSGAFGKNNIFAGGTGFNMKTMQSKAKSDLGSAKLTAARKGSMSGKLRGKNNLSAKAISTNKILSGKSLGQLKFAGHRSQAAMNAGDSGAAATYAADAFDQQKTQGGSIDAGAGAIGDGLGTVNPVGSGAPDATGSTSGACPSGWTQSESGCTPPDLEGVNQTRYQGLVDGAKSMADQAKMMYILAAVLFAAAVAAAIAGGLWGWIIAAVLAAVAVAVLMMARQMGNQAKQMGQMIDSMYGQQDQGKIIERAGDDAQGGEDSEHNPDRADRVEENVNENRYDESYGDETYRE